MGLRARLGLSVAASHPGWRAAMGDDMDLIPEREMKVSERPPAHSAAPGLLLLRGGSEGSASREESRRWQKRRVFL